MASLKPVAQGNLSERVYESLRSALIEGRFEPGERLRTSELAADLGVSITPVREAIFRLASDRGLEIKAATAVYVPELSVEDLKEIQCIRLHLEGEAAALAAERITRTELAKLEKIQDEFIQAAGTDPRESALLNRRFHFALITAAHAPLIYATVEKMWVLMGPLLRRFHSEMPPRELVSRNHKHFEVLTALRKKDPERARRAIQADISWGKVMVEWVARKT
jgi:DNA-binding GntR family transcriptional regulator